MVVEYLFKQKYLWMVERKLGNLVGFVSKGKKGPQTNEEGKIRLGKCDYTIDSRKFRTFKIPQGIRAGDIVRVQLYKEDEITPLDFFSPEKKVGDDITATMLQRISKIKRLELITSDSNLDKITIILAIALMVSVVVIGILGYLVAK
jgi:hypothetical protein